MPDAPERAVFPGQKRDQRTRRCSTVSIKKVKLLRVLETGRTLDKAQAEETDVEIHIVLDFPGNGRQVMNTAGHDLLALGVRAFARSCFDCGLRRDST
ncbi:hypothetical protein D3C73_1442060 [compost metagenome]